MIRAPRTASLVKHCVNPPVKLCPRLYTISSETEKLSVKFDDSTGIALMTMRSKPANLFDLDYITDFSNAMNKLDADKSCKGLIITSDVKGLFSGGGHVTEVYRPQPERFNLFWGMLQDMLFKVYISRLPTVAAINGIVPPESFGDMMVSVIGRRQAEKALQLGTMFSVDEALRVGLIDEVCEEKDILDKAQEQIRQWLSIPDYARELTKQYLHQPFVDKWISRKQADIDLHFELLSRPHVRAMMGRHLESLKMKSKKPKAKM